MQTPTPYAHTSYRAYIKAWMNASKKRSMRFVAKRVDCSASLVSMILSGKKHIPVASARTWSDAMHLEGEEAYFFEAMVRSEQGATPEIRKAAASQVRATAAFHQGEPLSTDSAALLLRWYVPVIMELTKNPSFQPEAEWVAQRIWPEVPTEEVAEALEALMAMEVLKKVNETWVTGPPLIANELPKGQMSRLASVFHQTQLEHASQALGTFHHDHRWLTSLTIALDPDDLPKLRAALQRFQLDVVEPFRGSEQAEQVVQLSVQMFPRSVPSP